MGTSDPAVLRARADARTTATMLAQLLTVSTEARDASVLVARELVPEPPKEATP